MFEKEAPLKGPAMVTILFAKPSQVSRSNDFRMTASEQYREKRVKY